MKHVLYNIYFKDQANGMLAFFATIIIIEAIAVSLASHFGLKAMVTTGIGTLFIIVAAIVFFCISIANNYDNIDDSGTIRKVSKYYGVPTDEILLVNDGAILYPGTASAVSVDVSKFECHR